MNNFFEILKNMRLFSGIAENEIRELIDCFSPVTKIYSKNQAILLSGAKISTVGIILSGNVQIIKEDFLGNRTIMAVLEAGDMFGETFACTQSKKMSVSVFAAIECEILFIDIEKIIKPCSSVCDFHNKLIQNMMQIIAEKNLMLNQKIEVLSKRSTRDKLITYLSSQAQKTGSHSFSIPLNRQELADYLCVDRSAMSNELGKLRDEGLLNFDRNSFELLDIEY